MNAGDARLTNIYLIGSYGAGKSTIGLALARILHKEFYDTDRLIEKRAGVDISWIFDIEGEDLFRKREYKLLQELSKKQNMVIATGGGTILLAESRKLIKKTGAVIHLKVELSQQLSRTKQNKHNRPLLQVTDVEKQLQKLNQQRQKLFEEIADVTFGTEHKRITNITKDIVKWVVEFDRHPAT